jgi:hypothetical protein
MSGDEYYTQSNLFKDINRFNYSNVVLDNNGHVKVRRVAEAYVDDCETDEDDSFFKQIIKWSKKKNKKKDMSQSPIPIPVEERVIVKANKNAYHAKYIAKHRAKNRVKTKFKIGRYYYQRIKPKDGSPNVVIKYQCVKTIYSIKDIETNIVIMRQITPYDGRKFTLDRQECQKFHIKYEPGLEVWPMEINWIPEKIIKN